jgi:hypothetical protein
VAKKPAAKKAVAKKPAAKKAVAKKPAAKKAVAKKPAAKKAVAKKPAAKKAVAKKPAAKKAVAKKPAAKKSLRRLGARFGSGFGCKLADFEAHFSAGLESDHGAFRDGHFGSRRTRIAADPRFAHPDFEYPEVAQFHFFPLARAFDNVVKRPLDDIEHMLLYQVGILANAKYQVALCQCHRQYGLLLNPVDCIVYSARRPAGQARKVGIPRSKPPRNECPTLFFQCLCPARRFICRFARCR